MIRSTFAMVRSRDGFRHKIPERGVAGNRRPQDRLPHRARPLDEVRRRDPGVALQLTVWPGFVPSDPRKRGRPANGSSTRRPGPAPEVEPHGRPEADLAFLPAEEHGHVLPRTRRREAARYGHE